jgi:hypothetical protein
MNAHPMEDLALSLPLKPGFVAISFRHAALRGNCDPLRDRYPLSLSIRIRSCSSNLGGITKFLWLTYYD